MTGVPEPVGGSSTRPDDVYAAISNERRRMILRYVNREGEGDVSYLAEYVASFETGKEIDELTSQERKARYVTLYQNHLPKLVDCGLLAYRDGRDHVVVPDGPVEDVVEAMDRIEQIDEDPPKGDPVWRWLKARMFP